MSASRTRVAAFFATHPVFRVEDFVRVHAHAGDRSPATSVTLLKHAVADGRLIRLRRGLYAVVPPGLAPERTPVDRFLLAAAHTPDAVIGFHAALDLHGRAWSVWNRFHVWTEHRAKPWVWRDAEIVPVLVPAHLRGTPMVAEGVIERHHAGSTLRVTTLERTLVDILDQPDKGGAWEEIERSLSMIELIDVDAVVAYTLRLDRALTAARVGWFLEHRQHDWRVDDVHLSALRAHRPTSPTYLDARRTPGRLDPAWNLIVPEDLPLLAAEGGP
jgi:predicted transcriptional regulator of viral defense system